MRRNPPSPLCNLTCSVRTSRESGCGERMPALPSCRRSPRMRCEIRIRAEKRPPRGCWAFSSFPIPPSRFPPQPCPLLLPPRAQQTRMPPVSWDPEPPGSQSCPSPLISSRFERSSVPPARRMIFHPVDTVAKRLMSNKVSSVRRPCLAKGEEELIGAFFCRAPVADAPGRLQGTRWRHGPQEVP